MQLFRVRVISYGFAFKQGVNVKLKYFDNDMIVLEVLVSYSVYGLYSTELYFTIYFNLIL